MNQPTVQANGTNVLRRNYLSKKEVIINVGGARSSKSHSIAQLMIALFSVPKVKIEIGICRKTMPALRMTAMRLVIDLLMDYGLYSFCDHNRSLNYIENPFNRSRIQFFSIDDPSKMKSTEFNFVWMEEANEFSWVDFILLKTRKSARNVGMDRPNQIFLSLNPDESTSWVAKRAILLPESEVIHSTYKDNPHLTQEYIDTLEGLLNSDPEQHAVFAKGEWGTAKTVVYTNYEFVDEIPIAGEVFYGMDFGFNAPSSLVKVTVHDDLVYIQELIYERHLTTPDIIEKLKELIPANERTREIYCDSAEPDRIQEISDAGFNAMASDKDVNKGIDTVKSYRLHILKSSDNIVSEITGYRWKKDKDNLPMDEPIKIDDHAMDAMRYAIRTHLKAGIFDGATGAFDSIRT